MNIEKQLVGKRIAQIRTLSREELAAEGWEGTHKEPRVLVLDDGTVIYALSDDEGNDAGVLCMLAKDLSYRV